MRPGPVGAGFALLATGGLPIRVMDGPAARPRLTNVSYAGITKGITAIGSSMMLGATRGGRPRRCCRSCGKPAELLN